MQCATRPLIVTVVGEYACFLVERIRPIGIVQSGDQNDQLQRSEVAPIPKTAHVAQAQESRQGIIACIPVSTTLVDCVDVEIGTLKL
jgi:hypothetical protein